MDAAQLEDFEKDYKRQIASLRKRADELERKASVMKETMQKLVDEGISDNEEFFTFNDGRVVRYADGIKEYLALVRAEYDKHERAARTLTISSGE